MQTAERAQAYREALDALDVAQRRYLELATESMVTGPLAKTTEARKAQYQQWIAEKESKRPALMAALAERDRLVDVRDAAFAALKGA